MYANTSDTYCILVLYLSFGLAYAMVQGLDLNRPLKFVKRIYQQHTLLWPHNMWSVTNISFAKS